MKTEQEYIKDLTEIRSMMERSTKFLTLTGWTGILAGAFALTGAFIAYRLFYLNDTEVTLNTLERQDINGDVFNLLLVALAVVALALATALYLPYRDAKRNGETLWNSSARRLLTNLAIPLVTGGIFILILFFKGMLGLMAPLTLIFYGMALLNASKFTYEEVRYLGITEIFLGLLASYFIGYGLLFWAIGFGVMHIIYGIYMQMRYGK